MSRALKMLVLSFSLSLFLAVSRCGSAFALLSSEKKTDSRTTAKGADSTAEAIIDEAALELAEQTDPHWHLGEYRHVINMYRVVVAARPNYTEGYINAGWLLWSLNRDDEAVALYEQGLKANPDTYGMYDELGFYYYNRKKDYKRAIPYYEKAVSFKDCRPFTIHMLAHAYERTKQLDKALKMWERAASMPDNQPAKVNLERVRKLMKQS